MIYDISENQQIENSGEDRLDLVVTLVMLGTLTHDGEQSGPIRVTLAVWTC